MAKDHTPSIVIADDEPAIRETVSFIFQQHGFKVYTACNGKEAFSKIKQQKPDVAFLDIKMPEGEGPEICAQIKKDKLLKKTFVVILTSNMTEGDKKRAIKKGADAFLTKPFHEIEIMGMVNKLIGNIKEESDGINHGT